MHVTEFRPSMADAWDAFVSESAVGNFLHSRKFLAYHKDRFVDLSVILQDKKGRMLAVFPAAQDRDNPGTVVSHPGATYGGLICSNGMRGNDVINGLTMISQRYAALGYRNLRYKAVPYVYHRVPFGDDLYALFRVGANRYRCDLSACIDLQQRGTISERRRRGYKKAVENDIQITAEKKFVPEFWQILEANLEGKHGKKPLHTIAEIQSLYSQFPNEIEFVMALHEGRAVAGVVLFNTPRTVHAQYIASSDRGNELGAMDYLVEHCIRKAGQEAFRYFDFGICNENEGQLLNAGLYEFKLGFGSGGVAYEFYDLELGLI